MLRIVPQINVLWLYLGGIFYVIMAHIIIFDEVIALKMADSSKLILSMVAGYSQSNDGCYYGSIDKTCSRLCMSRPTVINAFKELVREGWLIKFSVTIDGVVKICYKTDGEKWESLFKRDAEGGKKTLLGLKNFTEGGKEILPYNKDNNKDIERIKEYKEKESEEPLPSIDGIAEEEDQNLKAKKEKEERSAAKEEREKTFEGLWKDYGRKGSKAKSLEKFNRLSEEEIGRMKKHIPHYVRSTPDICYRKDMQTYINQKSFNDIIFDKRTNQVLFNPDNPDSVECKENIPKPKRPLWQVYGFPSEEEYKNAYKKH